MKFYHFLLIPLFVNSCAGAGEGDASTVTVDEMETTYDEDLIIQEEVEEELEGLVLNDGAKWKVDSSTHAGMGNIQVLVNDFDGENVKDLGKDIKSELKTIAKNCSMKGEDHNQYHILLKAMKKEAKLLKKEKSTDPAKMQKYLDAYEAHFELG